MRLRMMFNDGKTSLDLTINSVFPFIWTKMVDQAECKYMRRKKGARKSTAAKLYFEFWHKRQSDMWTVSRGIELTKSILKFIHRVQHEVHLNETMCLSSSKFLPILRYTQIWTEREEEKILRSCHAATFSFSFFHYTTSYSIAFHNKTHYSTIFHGSSI